MLGKARDLGKLQFGILGASFAPVEGLWLSVPRSMSAQSGGLCSPCATSLQLAAESVLLNDSLTASDGSVPFVLETAYKMSSS